MITKSRRKYVSHFSEKERKKNHLYSVSFVYTKLNGAHLHVDKSFFPYSPTKQAKLIQRLSWLKEVESIYRISRLYFIYMKPESQIPK